jgi:1-acyl-sn-glycerol-3-phosphate acyltransferase
MSRCIRDFLRAAAFFVTMPLRAAVSILLIISLNAVSASVLALPLAAVTTFFAELRIAVFVALLASRRLIFCLFRFSADLFVLAKRTTLHASSPTIVGGYQNGAGLSILRPSLTAPSFHSIQRIIVVRMRNAFVVTAILMLFAWYNILVGLLRILIPGKAAETTEEFARSSVRHIFSLMGFYCGVRLEIENRSGKELPSRFLLVTNHQSLIDIPVLMSLFPERKLRFVAKRELGDGIPWVSMILRTQGHALVRREGDAARSMRSIVRFAGRCRAEGTCPVVFPEGTRSRDGEVGPFRTAGVRKILSETPLPLVAAVLDGGWRVAKLRDVIRNLGGAEFKVRILSVDPSTAAKKEALAAIEKAREDIASSLEAMRLESSEGGGRKKAARRRL